MAPPPRSVYTMHHRPAQTSTDQQVFNISQAADYLGVDRSTMRRFITDGVVPTFQSGHTVRIRRAHLDQLFTSRQQQQP